MTLAPSPLSSKNAIQLLRQAIEREPETRAQHRVAARLEQSIANLLVPPAASGTAAAPTASAGTGTSTSRTANAGPAASAGPAAALGPLAASPKLWLGLTLLAGVAIGIGADRWATSEVKPSPAAARAVTRPSLLPATASAALDSTPLSDGMPTVQVEDLPKLPAAAQKRVTAELAPGQVVEPDSSPRSTEPPQATAEFRQATLREQQALLDQARLALGKGQPDSCLAALLTHHSRFPQSLLAEERDALTIKAMVASGNLTTAREQMAAFLTNYPRSMLIPSLEAIVGKIQ